MRALNLEGRRIGRLVVLFRLPSVKKNSRWLCRCDCGQELPKWQAGLLQKNCAEGCGCVQNRKHGQSRSKAYRSWCSAKARCSNPNNKQFSYYGGRGITMAPEWRDDFARFFSDMGPRPPGTSLDRIDNDGPYAPGNCRWATRKQQSWNPRQPRMIRAQGTTAPLAEWGRRLGITKQGMSLRRKAGWPEEAIATLPPLPRVGLSRRI